MLVSSSVATHSAENSFGPVVSTVTVETAMAPFPSVTVNLITAEPLTSGVAASNLNSVFASTVSLKPALLRPPVADNTDHV